nr:protein phosphatase 2C domain-containing protein [Lolliginicoccus lacisalsi]
MPLARPTVLAVADGVGGQPGGDVASRVALMELIAGKDRLASASGICGGMRSIHDRIRSVGRSTGLTGMATTVAGIAVGPGSLRVFNVGDSRVYLAGPDGALRQQSLDDVVRDAFGNPTHVLTQCLGRPGQAPQPNISGPGDGPREGGMGFRAVLCTDGIHSVLDEQLIERALLERSGLDCIDYLVETAIRRGSRDNYSLIIVEVGE